MGYDNLSHYGSHALAEVHNPDNTYWINQGVQVMPSSEPSSVENLSETEITSDSNIISYSQYLKETQQETSVEIDRLKQTPSEQLKEKESLMQTVTLLKNDFKKESRNIDREIALKKKIKQLDNIVYKRDQSAQIDVEQHRLESKTFEVKMNQVLNDNERLLEQVINKDIVNIIMNSTMDNASVNMHECKKCLKLEIELLNKKDFIEKETYDKLFRSYTTLEKHCISLEVDTQLNQENFQMENSVSNQSAPNFDQYFELNELKEKDLVITALKDELRKLKGKELADNIVSKHTVAPEMLKVDVEPIAPKLLNNKTTHSDYLRHTQEQAAILKEVV
ncbi:hypothetical protein Tco_1233113 [Tanacetum coccineum]